MIITDSATLWFFAARRSAQAMARTLVKHCNAAAEHHRDAHRVSLSRPTDFVAPLAKGAAIACEARLAMSLDKLTELAIIMLKEY